MSRRIHRGWSFASFLARHFGRARGGRIRLSVATGLIAKGSFILASLLLTPMLIRYLGNEGYGLFVTITAVVGWLQVTNFGVGAGLQNALTEAVTHGQAQWQRELVSTAFFFLFAVTTVIGVLAAAGFFFVPWESIFAAEQSSYRTQIAAAVGIVLAGFFSTSLLSFAGSVYAARQELHIPNTVGIANAALLIAATVAAIQLDLGLGGITAANVGTTVVVSWVFAVIYLLRPSARDFLPRFGHISRAAWSRLFGSSAAFFVLQLCSVALFQSDYFIIAHFLDVDEVTPYSVAAKPFAVLAAVFAAAVSQPLWAGYGNAKASGDIGWISRNHRRMTIAVMLLFAAAFALMLLCGKPLLTWWVGAAAAPSLTLLAATGLYYLVRQWTDLHAILVNGLDMMKPQAYSAVVHAVLTIALEIALIQHIGIIGVPIACFLGYALVSAWFLPLLVRRTLRKLSIDSPRAATSPITAAAV